MASIVSFISSQRNDKFDFEMGNIFQINVGPRNIQDIIIPNSFCKGLAEDHQSFYQTKFSHDVTTYFLHKFHLVLLHIVFGGFLTMLKTPCIKHVSFKVITFDVILVVF